MSQLKPVYWQKEDLKQLERLSSSANWSQMGCFKTSTALWLLNRRLRHIENPAVLIITTQSGKGSYFRDVPKCLPSKWQVVNVKSNGIHLIINGFQHKLGKTLNDEITFPHLVVTHYHLFSRSNMDQKEDCKSCEGSGLLNLTNLPLPCTDCNAKGWVWKPLTIGDKILRRKWDMIILDEAHKIKNPETKWTKSIKKAKTRTSTL